MDALTETDRVLLLALLDREVEMMDRLAGRQDVPPAQRVLQARKAVQLRELAWKVRWS